jgi:FMN-dependent NADH-azoreductase
MPTLLHLDASPRGNYSVSRQLSTAAVKAWKAKNPDGTIVERDLPKTALTFVDMEWIVGAFSAPDQHTDGNKRALAISDELVAEVLAADEIIIGTPMYNFAIPAVLKAWIDHVVRAGKTFRYTATGVDGLAKGRKVIVAVASGGVYEEASGMSAYNYEIPYLRHILGFIGISDVTFVQAGGTTAVAQGTISAEEFLAPFAKQIEEAI